MPQNVTRRRFMFQTLGVIGGAMVSGDLLPLLAEAAKRKQVLRVAIERDFETLRPELSAGDTNWMRRRVIPYEKVGRIVLFNIKKCDAALERFEVKSVGG